MGGEQGWAGKGMLCAPTCRSKNSHYLFPSMTSTEMPLSNGSFNAHCFIVRSVVVNLTIHVTVCTDLFRCRSTFGYTQPTSYKTNTTLKVLIQNRSIAHWSMVTHRLRNERTGFVFWTHRFLRKMADIRPLSQVRNIFYICFIAVR